MTITAPPPELLHRAVDVVLHELARSCPERLPIDEPAMWRELVGCIVGSAGRYEQAVPSVDRVCTVLPDPRSHLALNSVDLMPILWSALISRGPRPRFPRRFARQIADAAVELYGRRHGIRCLIESAPDAFTLRAWLVDFVPGLGPKQASLFIRNLSISNDVAVLDRHVLRYMAWVGLSSIGSPPPELSPYEAIEARLRLHADSLGLALADLDRAVWVAVRVWCDYRGRVS